MLVLLTIVSVICGWALLTVLVLALLMVMKPLQDTKRYMERIAFGVRAIEQQTSPLGSYVGALAGNLNTVAAELGKSAEGLSGSDAKFARAGELIRKLFGR